LVPTHPICPPHLPDRPDLPAPPDLELSLRNKTLFITGASRGIGLAIALRAAADGARIVIAAKTIEPHPKLPGTIVAAAAEIARAGGEALAVQTDVRDEAQVETAVARAVERFGGIDILVNNASAISLTGTEATPLKRFDLMHQANVRGTFVCTQKCLPHLRRASNPHVLNLAPPLESTLSPKWFAPYFAYTLSKYGMTLAVLGMAEELRSDRIAVNALWPRTAIDTAAIGFIGGAEARRRSRSPAIVAEAAWRILTKDSRTFTGRFLVDEDFLRAEGVTDFSAYRREDVAEDDLMPDFFL
jgi:citronellol/citronellal dehydrogenase